MNDKLSAELDRLFGLGGVPAGTDPRAAVLEVVLPTGWDALAPLWQGAQADLDLPAPAIAVSGTDALQLWFAFTAATPPAARGRLLRRLRERYLPDVAAAKVRVHADPAALPPAPVGEVAPQCWSAFVTPDLASVFAGTPWLDFAPTDDGQAAILRPLSPTTPAALDAALRALDADDRAPSAPGPTAAGPDPARFLAGVMNDVAAPLALRIEAARILLRVERSQCPVP